jgi:hypothetical protein
MLYLPLDKLMQQAGAGDPNRSAPTQTGNASAASAGESRAESPAPIQQSPRDALRNRERDTSR